MKQIHYIANAYAEKQEADLNRSDLLAFVQGKYFMDALLATVGNMFTGKDNHFDYPKEPYSMQRKEYELTEDEIQQQRDQFIATLMTMQHNFKLNKKKSNEDKGSE